MTNRRYTRLTNAFSKKIENHSAAVALGYFRVQLHQDSSDAALHARYGRWRDGTALGSL
jgi:hypothetical protein